MTVKPRNGILAAGNWILDRVKVIDHFPPEDGLALIFEETTANGGGPYNLLKDLARMKAGIPLAGAGLLGDDVTGDEILEDCRKHGIDTKLLVKSPRGSTSYTDVMTVKASGRRTFFHQKGANSLLDVHHFDFSKTSARFFHLGYLLLLDRLDEFDSEGRTGASHVLEKALQAGLQTAVDVVSESGDRFPRVVPPSLPYTDFLIINEYEAGKITGFDLRESGKIRRDRVLEAAGRLKEMGVRQWVIIHFPEGAVAQGNGTGAVFQPSLDISEAEVVGAAGAGDAFAAGVLYGLHENHGINECLRFGACVSASCLFDSTTSGGILPMEQCLRLPDRYGWRRGGFD